MMKIGIVGGGQLARMLALAGVRLGYEFSFLLDARDCRETRCIEGLGKTVVLEDGCSWRSIYDQLGCPDVITVEKEQIDVAVLQGLNEFCPVYPTPETFKASSHRQWQKQCLIEAQIPCARFAFVPGSALTPPDLGDLRFPLVAKSTHNAYDGKNQIHLPDRQAFDEFLLQRQGDWIVEEKIEFRRELSIVAARSTRGELVFYAPSENIHHQGVLIYSISPVEGLEPALCKQLEDYARRLLLSMEYVGVLAIECFDTPAGLLVNEIAPRVHNSGHWTSSGSVTCQFENHLRAITGLPLGATDSLGSTAMVNLLGIHAPPLELLNSRSSLHWYHKSSRPGRKVGHINLHNPSFLELKNDVHRMISEIGTHSLSPS